MPAFPALADLMTTSRTLADQIEKAGHALTADELSKVLSVSRITIFKQAKAGRQDASLHSASARVYASMRKPLRIGCEIALDLRDEEVQTSR